MWWLWYVRFLKLTLKYDGIKLKMSFFVIAYAWKSKENANIPQHHKTDSVWWLSIANYRLFKLLHDEGTAQQPRLFFKLYNTNKGNDAVNISNIPNPSLVFHNILSWSLHLVFLTIIHEPLHRNFITTKNSRMLLIDGPPTCSCSSSPFNYIKSGWTWHYWWCK